MLPILLNRFFRTFNADTAGKSEDPAVEGRARADTDLCPKMLFIYRLRPETLPEIVNQILHGGDMAEEGDFLRLICIIHTKNRLVVFLRIVAFRRCRCDFMQNRRLPLDPVQPECPHRLPLIAESADIIVIAIPGQLIGAEGVWLSVIRDIALLIHIKIRVIEPDLTMQVDGIVDRVDAVVAGMIAALIAVRDGNML